MRLRVVSYNIHKGLTSSGLKKGLDAVKKLFIDLQPDIIMLQEVVGEHSTNKYRVESAPDQSQFEFLADEFWPHYAYGQNALYSKGHHGNCILSKFPIITSNNLDISTHRLEQRGLLHATVHIPDMNQNIELLSTHLNLLKRCRDQQIIKVTEYIQNNIKSDAPLIFCGDFNDWQKKISPFLNSKLALNEFFLEVYGEHIKTFPSHFPLLPLDRIYYKNLTPKKIKTGLQTLKLKASDHLPLLGEFDVSPK